MRGGQIHEAVFALAAALDRDGCYEEAIALAEAAHGRLLELVGAKNTATIKSRQVINHARQELTKMHLAEGNAAREAKRHDDARAAYEAAVSLSRLRVADEPKPLRRYWLGRALSGLANALRGAGEYADAKSCYEEAITLYTALSEEVPDTERYGVAEGNLLSQFAVLLGTSGQPIEALEAWRRCSLSASGTSRDSLIGIKVLRQWPSP